MPDNGDGIYEKYSGEGGYGLSLEETRSFLKQVRTGEYDPAKDNFWVKPYKIPLKVVRTKIHNVKVDIEDTLYLFEEFLQKVYINPFLDPDIEECHFHIWKEIKKKYKDDFISYMKYTKKEEVEIFDENGNLIQKIENAPSDVPGFVSYAQYQYAEKHGCRTCRKFVKEYDRLISHSVFVHIFDFRYYLTMLLHEANCISESLSTDFGEDYEDESQEQAAEFYYSWAKMAESHTKLLAEQIGVPPDKLPESEVDHITKKQAAQFQAFFSIRVASYSETIDNLLFSIQKDLVDTCDSFYKRYVSPAIRFKTKVANPLEFEVETTAFMKTAPILSEEVISVINAMRGNFGSILTDMIQRRNNISKKFNYLFSIIIQRKKYISYIDQLSSKGSSRPKVTIDVKEDIFSKFFDEIIIDDSEKNSLLSDHGNLDNLLENHHTQYLLRSGGLIEGNIDVAAGITIDGVDLSDHSHNGDDGSVRILSTDIDFSTPREEDGISIEGNSVFNVTIDDFIPEILTGGTPVVNAVVTIELQEIDKDDFNKYEFEIIYKEN